jgi:hypothetical protein
MAAIPPSWRRTLTRHIHTGFTLRDIELKHINIRKQVCVQCLARLSILHLTFLNSIPVKRTICSATSSSILRLCQLLQNSGRYASLIKSFRIRTGVLWTWQRTLGYTKGRGFLEHTSASQSRLWLTYLLYLLTTVPLKALWRLWRR